MVLRVLVFNYSLVSSGYSGKEPPPPCCWHGFLCCGKSLTYLTQAYHLRACQKSFGRSRREGHAPTRVNSHGTCSNSSRSRQANSRHAFHVLSNIAPINLWSATVKRACAICLSAVIPGPYYCIKYSISSVATCVAMSRESYTLKKSVHVQCTCESKENILP